MERNIDVIVGLTGVSETKKGFDELATGSMAMGEKFKEAGGKITQVGKDLLPMSATVGALGIAAAKSGADYDREFSKITGLVGVAASEVEKMKTKTLELAGSTARAPQELATAMFTISSAGLQGAAGAEALEMAAKGAAAGMGETRDLAQAMAGIMNAYKGSNIDASQSMDVLTATVRAGNFEASELAASIGRVLPNSSALGVSMGDVGGAIALFTRVNGSASQSVTQLDGIVRAFIKPTQDAKAAMAEYGISADDVRAKISSDGLPAALQFLDNALGNNKETLARVIPESTALTGAFQILAADAATLESTFGQTNNATGMLGDAFSAAAGTDSFKMEQAMVAIKVALIEVGSVAAPIVASALGAVTTVIQGAVSVWNSLPGGVQQAIGIFGAFLAALAPIALAVGGIVSAVGGMMTAFAAVSGVVATVGAAVGGLALGPLALAIGAVVLAIVLWGDKLKPIATGIMDMVSGIASLVAAIVGPAISAISAIIEKLGGLEKIANVIGAVIGGLATGIGAAFSAIGTAAGAVGSAFDAVGGAVMSLGGVFGGGESAMMSFANSIPLGDLDAMRAMLDNVTSSGNGTEAQIALLEGEIKKLEQAEMAVSASTVEANRALALQDVAASNAAREAENLAIKQEAAARAMDANATSGQILAQRVTEQLNLNKEYASSWDAVTSSMSAYNSMLNGLTGGQQSYDAAVLGTISAFEGLGNAAKDVDTAARGATGALDLTDASTRALVTSAREAAQAAQEEAVALATVSGDADKARDAHTGYIEQLRATLTQSGLTRAEVDDLVATYGTVPDSVLTQAALDGVAAQEGVNNLFTLFEQYRTANPEALLQLNEADAQAAMARGLAELAGYDGTAAVAVLDAASENFDQKLAAAILAGQNFSQDEIVAMLEGDPAALNSTLAQAKADLLAVENSQTNAEIRAYSTNLDQVTWHLENVAGQRHSEIRAFTTNLDNVDWHLGNVSGMRWSEIQAYGTSLGWTSDQINAVAYASRTATINVAASGSYTANGNIDYAARTRYSTIYVTSVTTNSGGSGHYVQEDGGLWPQGVTGRAFASGGFTGAPFSSQDLPPGVQLIPKPQQAQMFAANGPGLVYFDEPSTGGEAMIPLAGSKRRRSSMILSQVADMFGMMLVPRGGMSFADGGFTRAEIDRHQELVSRMNELGYGSLSQNQRAEFDQLQTSAAAAGGRDGLPVGQRDALGEYYRLLIQLGYPQLTGTERQDVNNYRKDVSLYGAPNSTNILDGASGSGGTTGAGPSGPANPGNAGGSGSGSTDGGGNIVIESGAVNVDIELPPGANTSVVEEAARRAIERGMDQLVNEIRMQGYGC